MALLIAGLFLCFFLLTGCLGFAFWKGGRDERTVAAIMLAAVIATQFASLAGNNWRGPEYWVMAVDAATFVAFLVTALRSTRFWPLWVASAQLVATLTHLAPILMDVDAHAYAIMQPIWIFPVMIALTVGTYHHQSRLAAQT